MTSTLLTLSGTVGIRERIAIPPGAVATVKVVDSDGEVLAATAIPADGVPVDWTLTVDAAMVPDRSRLLIWAALRTEAGWWGTLDLVPVGEVNEILLSRVPD